MAARLAQATRIEFGNGASFIASSIGAMEARPADPFEREPKSFVWTGYRPVTLTVPLADFDAAYALMQSNGLQPVTLVHGDERLALAFASQSLTTSFYDANIPRSEIRGEFDGLLYDKAADGQPVTDEATIAYLVEKYKPREYTPDELGEPDEYDDYDEESDDAQDRIYKSIKRRLFARYPDAAWGPAHVCIEDENWDAYADAIERTNVTIAVRALTAIGHYVDARHVAKEATRNGWDVSTYDDHSMGELGATLDALRLIEWHENGCVGIAPADV